MATTTSRRRRSGTTTTTRATTTRSTGSSPADRAIPAESTPALGADRALALRIPNPDGPPPPLPLPIADTDPATIQARAGSELIARPLPGLFPRIRSLRGGCYLLRYTPVSPPTIFGTTHYDGTLRVERAGANTIASGDLYVHTPRLWPFIPELELTQPIGPIDPGDPLGPVVRGPIVGGRDATPGNGHGNGKGKGTAAADVGGIGTAVAQAQTVASIARFFSSEPNPGSGIPIFARSRYRYYVDITQILESFTFSTSFTMGFQLHRFTAASNSWSAEPGGPFTAQMAWTGAPPGYPSAGDYLTGEVHNASGGVVGNIEMGWIADALRKATIEIDRVPVSELPMDNGSGVGWGSIFGLIGWDLTIVPSDSDVVEPSGASWSNAEAHAAMLARRNMSNLDAEWRYHILCVQNLDETPRGIMYDSGATDSNNVPREGAVIASHWTIPMTTEWGRVRGMRFGTATGPYFRTAVHEIGHAMGLYHNTVDMGIMNTTDVIAASAIAPVQFPDNVQWSHAPDDQKRLRHMPDIWVRPGGIPFGLSYSTSPISPDDLVAPAHGLAVDVTPVLTTVPIGAPVRVDYALVNRGDAPLPTPSTLSLKSGFVKGKVVDPAGTVRTFLPLVLCVDEDPLRMLEPGDRLDHAATLLRGPQGALFPMAGPHRVIVEIEWQLGGTTVGTSGETTVFVTAAQTDAHAEAARQVLSTPDALLSLVIGGDHLEEGNAAIDACLANPVLRPHYAVTEAKRVADRFGDRKPDLEKASKLLSDAVMTQSEVESFERRASRAPTTQKAGRASVGKVLREKATDGYGKPASREVRDRIGDL